MRDTEQTKKMIDRVPVTTLYFFLRIRATTGISVICPKGFARFSSGYGESISGCIIFMQRDDNECCIVCLAM